MKKVCNRCGKSKKLGEFYANKLCIDGRANPCKECKRTYATERRLQTIEASREYDRRRGYRGDPVKQRARQKVRTALKSGRLTRQPCRCGSTKVEAHHAEYSRPLDVVWLCKKHHAQEHRV